MRIFSEVRGFEKIKKRFEKISPEINDAVWLELSAGVLAIHADAVKSIQAQGSKLYDAVRYGPKRTVRVSKPGEPPNTDTGRLVRSIGFDLDKSRLTGRVGTNLEYGKILELSPRPQVRRPWLAPAYKRHVDKIVKAIEQAFHKAVK